MDLLQIALIFLIALLSIFLSITGIQVFLILRDLKKALDRLNGVLETGEEIVKEVEKPIAKVSETVSRVESGIRTVTDLASVLKPARQKSPSKPKFYKKIMK
jgi:hypothetical protein